MKNEMAVLSVRIHVNQCDCTETLFKYPSLGN